MIITRQEALNILLDNGVIAYPTESVFGIGSKVDSNEAILKILDLKKRDKNKGMIIISSNFKFLEKYIDIASLTKDALDLLNSKQERPTTWVVPASDVVLKNLIGSHNKKIAVRICDMDIIKYLCEGIKGPLISTSANISGYNALKNSLEVDKCFGDSLKVVDEFTLGVLRPSKIVDLLTMKVLRD
ncbi:MAG: L-threonylcarbamoyladenylate synthase [Psittacicella sp.]